MSEADYSLLDEPEILEVLFYPRKAWHPAPQGSEDLMVPMAEGIEVSCRFHPCGREAPTILYFHGNGEVVSDYNDVAPLYKELGVNLFLSDYRGYGRSQGIPSFTAIIADAQVIFRFLIARLSTQGYVGPLYVMGRSLGAYPALELASTHQDELAGLIIESGLANPTRLLRLLDMDPTSPRFRAMEKVRVERLCALSLPVLMIHGERDNLIPLSEAVKLTLSIGSTRKELVIIPGVGHNDIFYAGLQRYLAALKRFIFGESVG